MLCHGWTTRRFAQPPRSAPVSGRGMRGSQQAATVASGGFLQVEGLAGWGFGWRGVVVEDLVNAASSALVTAMATDAWSWVKEGFVRIFGRGGVPVKSVGDRLEASRGELLVAAGDETVRARIESAWRTRILEHRRRPSRLDGGAVGARREGTCAELEFCLGWPDCPIGGRFRLCKPGGARIWSPIKQFRCVR